MTRADHASGSDRIFEAVEAIDPEGRHDIVVNVQGDLPTIDPRAIAAAIAPLADAAVDIATLAAAITRRRGAHRPERGQARRQRGRARAPAGALFHPRHRALRRGAALPPYRPLRLSPRALARFVALPPSPLEQRERLEQLRALEAGMRIDARRRRRRAARRRYAPRSRARARRSSRRRQPMSPRPSSPTRASPAPTPTSPARSATRTGSRCPAPTFEDAFAAVEDGEADLAMIPIENSIAGRVADIHHLLPDLGAAHRRRALPADPFPAARRRRAPTSARSRPCTATCTRSASAARSSASSG